MDKRSSNPKVITKKHIARLERERRQVNLIRGIAIGGIVIVALLLLYGYLNLNFFVLRNPVAEVNGVKITTGEWQERVRLAGRPPRPSPAAARGGRQSPRDVGRPQWSSSSSIWE